MENLPVELIADIMGELDLQSLIAVSYVSRRLFQVSQQESLNPWRQPVLRNLQRQHGAYEDCFKHLSFRTIVPRNNFVEILSMARPDFLLFEASLPNLKEREWEEAFRRRFLPGWEKWRKDGTLWRVAFLKTLQRVWHRSVTSCSTDEAWTKYIMLNRRGSANQFDVTSRNFNPLAVFNEMKLHSNLAHLETRVRLVLQLADVRILGIGVLNKPSSYFSNNTNAYHFLHPTEIDNDNEYTGPRLTHPLPAASSFRYPYKTPGRGDGRDSIRESDQGLGWVGGFMIVAQLRSAAHDDDFEMSHSQYGSFTWPDLFAIAPWMRDKITKCIDGPGLGL